MNFKQLCGECFGLLRKPLGNLIMRKPIHDPEDKTYETRHQILSLLELATCNACPVCTLLSAQLKRKMWEAGEKYRTGIEQGIQKGVQIDSGTIFVTQRHEKSDHGPPVYIDVALGVHADIPGVSKLGINGRWDFHVKIHLDPFVSPASAIPIEPFTGSAYAFILIKQWLECCTTKHSSCKSALADDLDHPTRLLAVDKGQFKLVETTDLEKTPAYLTLSHCWGSIEILKLTRENIQDFRYGIPEDQLCKTFADAIYITRTLGFQYLWIDSLCIIQNDVEDWRKEASKMSSVYGGSSLNLAASAASDGREGCFFSRNDADMQRMAHQQIQWTKNSQRWTFNCIDPTLYTSCMQDCPLNQRGWTFQERFLSPKTLHFTKLQLYWECRESMACEMYQEALPNFVQNGSFGFLERRDAKKAWARAVEQYSARKLTFEKDRLPAIAGVARWVHNQTGDEYVAGLWRINLEEQLLWNTYESLPSQPHRGNAPSWSWASYDQRIDLFTADEEQTKLMFCRVVDIELKFKGHDPYGETASGRLELRTGPLIGVTFVNAAPEYLNRRRSIMGFAFDTKGQHNTVGSWYFLPICKIGDELGEQTIEGLILQAIPGTGDGQFRRVGTFMERFVSKFPIATAMEDPKCWADRSVYKGDAGVDDSGKLQYFITLV